MVWIGRTPPSRRLLELERQLNQARFAAGEPPGRLAVPGMRLLHGSLHLGDGDFDYAKSFRSSVCLSGESIREETGWTFYDSLIVSAAAAARCQVLFTEGLQAGRVVRGVEIRNPFA